jgi:hypothetical protein
MFSASEDVNPTSSHLANQTFVNFTDPEITNTYKNPNHKPPASVDDIQAMDIQETVITKTQTQTFINPPPIIDTNIILRSGCIEIFESLMELVEDRIKAMPSGNYID